MFGIHVLMAPGFVTSIAHDCSTTSQTLVIGLFVFALCDFVQLAKVGLCAASRKQHITTSKGRAHCHRSLFHVGVRDLCVVICDATMCVWCAGGALLGVAPRFALAQETRLSALALHMSLCLYCESVGDSWRFLVIPRDS